MNNLQRIQKFFENEEVDRPPFSPAIYEHKAYLINETPSGTATDSEKLFSALVKEYETYEPDFLTVGLDIYNIEAEAIGAEVKYFKDNSVPAVVGQIIDDPDDIEFLKIPNPLKDGRMPVILETARKISRELNSQVYIRGAVSGPFSLASAIYGFEKLLLSVITEPDTVVELLEFSYNVIKEFAGSLIDIGVGVVVFDSRCAPPNISPAAYEKLIAPYHTRLMEYLEEAGLKIKPLIIGGDTTLLVDKLLETKANLILSDYNSDPDRFFDSCRSENIFIRRNFDPVFLYDRTPDEIYAETEKILEKGFKNRNFLLGTGIVPFDTPVENVLAVKKALIDFSNN